MQIDSATKENSMEFPQKKNKKQKTELPYDSAVPFQSIYPKEMNHQLRKILYLFLSLPTYLYIYPHIHWSIIYNSQDMEKIYQRIDKENMIYKYIKDTYTMEYYSD